MSGMRQVAVVSGKGGTGKTTISASLAVLMRNGVVVDADVDAPNLHILLKPEVEENHRFLGGFVAEINVDLCENCGRCRELCRFDAVLPPKGKGFYRVNPVACDGCSLCHLACPVSAVKMVQKEVGHWYRSNTRHGPLFHALLHPGEDNSGKLVTQIRTAAQEFARSRGLKRILIDGPPGIGCPVISSLTGVDAALLVVEPTTSGIHDARRIVELTATFNLDIYLLVNRFDINKGITEKIEGWCREIGLESVGRIPLDPSIPRLLSQGKTPLEAGGETRAIIEKLYLKLFNQKGR
jgi:MinD superfamily P-loop ATPase